MLDHPVIFGGGDPWPSNRWFNGLKARAMRGVLLSAGAGLEKGPKGLGLQRVPQIWALIGGSTPSYSFQEVTPDPAGGFTILPGGRTDDGGKQPAYEVNGVTGLAGTYQRLRFSTADDWRFQDIRYGTGSGGSGSGGSGTVNFCFCDDVPTTLTMTSANPSCNYGMFQSCTIEYGDVPAEYAALDLGAQAFISVESFPDVIAGGALFQYLLTCQYNVYSLTRIYPTSPYGSPYIDGVLYTWFVGSYGNTCSPFHLDNGTAYLGSDGTCSVTIDS